MKTTINERPAYNVLPSRSGMGDEGVKIPGSFDVIEYRYDPRERAGQRLVDSHFLFRITRGKGADLYQELMKRGLPVGDAKQVLFLIEQIESR